jgi:hypothetical protein
MKRGAATVGVLAWALTGAVGPAAAWDHLDGDQTSMEPGADITDLYSWMSPDGKRVNMILNVTKGAAADAKFPDNVQYVFHTASRAAVRSNEGARAVTVLCTFDASQAISCWAGKQFVSGNASQPAGITNSNGTLRVFAGVRNDPFFMNKQGWDVFAETVHRGNRMGYVWDAAMCPQFAPERARRAMNELKTADERGSAGFDHYASLNVMSIVLSVDKAVLTADGPIVSVWASTNRTP